MINDEKTSHVSKGKDMAFEIALKDLKNRVDKKSITEEKFVRYFYQELLEIK